MEKLNQMKKLALGVLCLAASGLPALTLAANPVCDQMPAQGGRYALVQGSQQDVRYPARIERIAIGDPEIADVQVTTNTAFLITAKKPGQTSLLVWTSCSPDPLRSQVAIEGGSVNNLRTAKGKVAPEVLPSQVQTDIRFVEVSRTKLQQASTSLYGNRRSSNFLFGSPGASGGVTVSPGSVPNGTPAIPLLADGFNIVWGGGGSRVLGILSALESSGFAYTLAQPSLVALSGQSAYFLAGGEFPIPVAQSGTNNSITVEFKEFGVRLTITPTVISDTQILLKVAPEVSELDFANGFKLNDLTVPALRVRRTDTTISIGSGESFVISGLISKGTITNADKFPILGDLPILGAFFRSSKLDSEDKELLMVVTPRLVRPLAENAVTPKLPGEALKNYDPNFLEFYFMENGRYDRRRSSSNGFSN